MMVVIIMLVMMIPTILGGLALPSLPSYWLLVPVLMMVLEEVFYSSIAFHKKNATISVATTVATTMSGSG